MDDDAFNPVHVRHSIGRSSTSAAAEAAVSRQKSCNACVRGKRRCDKTKPRCTRCAVRGLDCVYHTRAPRRPSAGSPSTSSPSSSSSAAVSVAGGGGPTAASSGDHLPGLSADFDMGGFDAYDLGSSGTGTTSSGGTLELDPSLDFSIADLIGAGAGTGSSLWNIPGLAEPKANYPVPVPVSPPPYQPIRDLAILEASCISECVSAETHQVHDPRSRVGFVVSQLAEMHTTFARTRALPFIHPHLYARHVPRCIMSAFCAATAYANRTPATKGWVVRLVAGAAREIQEEGRRVSGTTQTPAEHLAKVQALLLVDTIRIFDGDISMRHAAEKERAVLQEWMKELVDVVKELPQYYEAQHGSKALRNRPPKSWDVSDPGHDFNGEREGGRERERERLMGALAALGARREHEADDPHGHGL